jgi:hypothetical protein
MSPRRRREALPGSASGAGEVIRRAREARCSVEGLSAVAARLAVAFLVPDKQPVLVAIDHTLFHRYGRTVHAASWFHEARLSGRRRSVTAPTGSSLPSWSRMVSVLT